MTELRVPVASDLSAKWTELQPWEISIMVVSSPVQTPGSVPALCARYDALPTETWAARSRTL